MLIKDRDAVLRLHNKLIELDRFINLEKNDDFRKQFPDIQTLLLDFDTGLDISENTIVKKAISLGKAVLSNTENMTNISDFISFLEHNESNLNINWDNVKGLSNLKGFSKQVVINTNAILADLKYLL